MGLIRKAIFLGTAATGTPLVRWNSSAEAAAKEQRRLMQEQNDILSRIADRNDVDENGIPLPGAFSYDELDDEDDVEAPRARVVKPSAPSLTDQLTEIKALLDKGIITSDEHAAMRKKILGV